METPDYDPAAEVVELCRELIRIDTTNYGDQDGTGERKAAEYVAGLLDEVGHRRRTSTRPSPGGRHWSRAGGPERRPATRCWCTGTWTSYPRGARTGRCDPFSGEIQDGYVWGRGAVDMKDFDAMLLSCVRARARAGVLPGRADGACFTADEEAGGHRVPSGSSTSTPTSSRTAPRRSARWAASPPPSAAAGST